VIIPIKTNDVEKNMRQSLLNAPCITKKYGVTTKYLQGVQALPGFFF
jgi:hypothetical protein